MILNVIKYPDKILRQKSKAVEKFDTALHKILDDMYDTMIARNGIGISAVQVGILIRAFIINLPVDINNDEGIQLRENLIEFINPVFTFKEGEIFYREGCLSVPDFYEDVKRFEKIDLSFQDRFGNESKISADGLLSIAIQHEFDHLDGILFVDKLSILKRKKFEKELRNAKKTA